jgi:hypothetical protein
MYFKDIQHFQDNIYEKKNLKSVLHFNAHKTIRYIEAPLIILPFILFC